MQSLTIGDVAREAGLSASTIRYYEEIGLLPEPGRVNGRRRYDRTVLRHLAVIQLAKASGYSLEDINVLLHGFTPATPPAERWRTLAEDQIRAIDGQIAELERQRRFVIRTRDCQCASLSECAGAPR